MKMNKVLTDDAKLAQEKKKLAATTKDIDSRYAKLNSRGLLMCIICGTPIKSKIIWQAHINKRSHKEKLAKLKEKQLKISSLPYQKSIKQENTGNLKRQTAPTDSNVTKKICIDKPKGILKKLSTYDSSDEESDSESNRFIKKENSLDSNLSLSSAVSEFPSNIGDDIEAKANTEDKTVVDAESQLKRKLKGSSTSGAVLPEGFFDDPVADAKARNVEYRDKEEEEWLTFMKEVSAAEVISKKIIADDKEEAAIETQIEQTNEQIKCLERIVELDKEKTTQLMEKKVNTALSDSGNSSDEEFSPVTWRTKNSLI